MLAETNAYSRVDCKSTAGRYNYDRVLSYDFYLILYLPCPRFQSVCIMPQVCRKNDLISCLASLRPSWRRRRSKNLTPCTSTCFSVICFTQISQLLFTFKPQTKLRFIFSRQSLEHYSIDLLQCHPSKPPSPPTFRQAIRLLYNVGSSSFVTTTHCNDLKTSSLDEKLNLSAFHLHETSFLRTHPTSSR